MRNTISSPQVLAYEEHIETMWNDLPLHFIQYYRVKNMNLLKYSD